MKLCFYEGDYVPKQEKLVDFAYTGTRICDMADLHEYIEQISGHKGYTHEPADGKIVNEIRKVRQDSLRLCAK